MKCHVEYHTTRQRECQITPEMEWQIISHRQCQILDRMPETMSDERSKLGQHISDLQCQNTSFAVLPVISTSSSSQELVAAKTRLDSWREADGQLLEAISVRKTATLGAVELGQGWDG